MSEVPLIDADGDGYIDLPRMEGFMPTHMTDATYARLKELFPEEESA